MRCGLCSMWSCHYCSVFFSAVFCRHTVHAWIYIRDCKILLCNKLMEKEWIPLEMGKKKHVVVKSHDAATTHNFIFAKTFRPISRRSGFELHPMQNVRFDFLEPYAPHRNTLVTQLMAKLHILRKEIFFLFFFYFCWYLRTSLSMPKYFQSMQKPGPFAAITEVFSYMAVFLDSARRP